MTDKSVAAYLNPATYRKPPLPPEPQLARCGLCGEEEVEVDRYGQVMCINCAAIGPCRDPDGAKWNAMQKALREHRLLREYVEAVANGGYANARAFGRTVGIDNPGGGSSGTSRVASALLAKLDAQAKHGH